MSFDNRQFSERQNVSFRRLCSNDPTAFSGYVTVGGQMPWQDTIPPNRKTALIFLIIIPFCGIHNETCSAVYFCCQYSIEWVTSGVGTWGMQWNEQIYDDGTRTPALMFYCPSHVAYQTTLISNWLGDDSPGWSRSRHYSFVRRCGFLSNATELSCLLSFDSDACLTDFMIGCPADVCRNLMNCWTNCCHVNLS
jgi:hypothetical protein